MTDVDHRRLNDLRAVASANLDDARSVLFDGRKRRRLAEVLELMAAVRRGDVSPAPGRTLDTAALVDELADIHDLIVGASNGPKLADQAIIAFRQAIGLKLSPEAAVTFVFRGMALFLLSLFAILAALIAWNGLPSNLVTLVTTPSGLLLCAASGAAGAMVSVAMRIGHFEVPDYWTPDQMVLRGLERPVIGAAMGVLSYASIKGGLLPIDVGVGDQQIFAYTAIAFGSGFAERVGISPVDALAGRSKKPAAKPAPDSSGSPSEPAKAPPASAEPAAPSTTQSPISF